MANDLTFNIDDYLGTTPVPASANPVVDAGKAAIDEFRSDAHDILNEVDDILRDYDLSAMSMTLARYVEDRFYEARNARRAAGVDAQMQRCANAYQSRYNPEDMEMVAATSDIYAPLTNTKCRGLRDWITDILANAEDKPWTLQPSPEPELPEWMQEEIVKRLELEVMSRGVPPDIMQQAREYKELGKKHASAIAAERTASMEDRIYDQMLKSDWRDAFGQFVEDLSYMPGAILHGPGIEMRRELKWRDGVAVEVETPTYVMRRVNPPDFYPAPGSTTTQDAPYLCEVRPYTADQLLGSIPLYGVDQSAVRKLLAQSPSGHSISDARPGGRPPGQEHTTGPARVYETIHYVGAVDGSVLLEHGLTGVDPQGTEQMDIWVCDGIVLRALRNPYPLQRRPYHSAVFMRKAGSFWGTPLPELLETPQRLVNAAARNLARDIAFTSGPVGEYDVERLVGEDRLDEFSPYRLYAVKPDYTSGGAAALRFQKLTSSAPTLMGVYDRFMKEADDVSGVPAYVIGNPNVAGAGRTLGGLSLLMGNAAKGVKRVIASIDKSVIEPVVSMFYHLNLMYSPDDSIKADAQVVARGATGLLQRELSQSRAAEVLPLLTQGMQLGLVQPSAIATVMRDLLKLLGYDADLVEDPMRQMLLMQAIQGAGGMPGGMSVPGGAPPNSGASAPVLPPAAPAPSLDGRSALPPDPGAQQITG